MDLKDKLALLNGTSGIRPSRISHAQKNNIKLYVDGEEVETDLGFYYHSKHIHPGEKEHGKYALKDFPKVSNPVFHLVGKDLSLANISLEKSLFIDTETTGLAGGTGTVPFLIGVGHFAEEGFLVDQYFMRDYPDERAVLSAMMKNYKGYETVVTYNGKSYDMPLIDTRYTLHRLENPFTSMKHLDLLHTSRRIWKRRLGDCSLGNIEKRILKFERQNDVPGFMIPGIYFDYLRSGDAKPLEGVFLHNRWDIVTLAILMLHAGCIFDKPEEYLSAPDDLFSMAKQMDDLMTFEKAAKCYRKILTHKPEKQLRNETLTQYGFSLKRSNNLRHAEKVWQHMIKHLPNTLSAYEELAKYYEHHLKNLEMAASVVEKALERIQILEALYPATHYSEDRRDLEYRLQRIERKQKKMNELQDKALNMN